MIPWIALFWTVSSLVGFALTLTNLVIAYRGWRYLQRFSRDEGVCIMAWSYVRGDAIRLWMHLTFLFIGAVGLSRPAPAYPIDWQGWAATLILMSVPLLLIALSYFAAEDRSRAARTIPPDDG